MRTFALHGNGSLFFSFLTVIWKFLDDFRKTKKKWEFFLICSNPPPPFSIPVFLYFICFYQMFRIFRRISIYIFWITTIIVVVIIIITILLNFILFFLEIFWKFLRNISVTKKEIKIKYFYLNLRSYIIYLTAHVYGPLHSVVDTLRI